jgi:hypothetical protein
MNLREEAKYATVVLSGGRDDQEGEMDITLSLYGGGTMRFHADHRGMMDLGTGTLMPYEEEQDTFGCIYGVIPWDKWTGTSYTFKVDLLTNTIV